MGVKFDVITGVWGGEPMIVRSLAKIEEGLKRVTDPAIRNEDHGKGQGLLPLLHTLVPTEPAPTWEIALALSVAFELGRAAITGKADPNALRQLGGLVRGAQLKAKAAAWHDAVRPIWWEKRGQFPKGDPRRRRLSQQRLATKIVADLEGKAPGLPGYDQVLSTIKAWEKPLSERPT